ncbi:Deoxyuridine 5'-triphosphate nucleotidohydrolase [Candidatus Annandia pinicola]|nr:Deoxyuridine 5'-triphosphate nucleotidohydrolase [Candidatus Annandia pinicola]
MKINNIDIKIIDSKIGSIFPIPNYITKGSSGIDLIACIDKKKKIKPNKVKLVSTGLAIYIKDPNIFAIITPRSGLGHNNGIILGNTIGIIDSDYQGEIMISVLNRSNNIFEIKPGYRIAQIIFLPLIKVKFNLVKKFKLSKRGNKGIGHSGLI